MTSSRSEERPTSEPAGVEYFSLPSKRELSPRQIASRNAVLAAAAEAFLARGYAATSIDDIADRLGATKGRIYHYFRTKGEIFIGIHRLALDMGIRAVESFATATGPAVPRLMNMAEAHALLMMNEAAFMRLAVGHVEMNLASEGRTRHEDIEDIFRMRRVYESLFERTIADGIKSGEFRADNPSLMAKAVLGTLNWVSVWYDPRRDASDASKKEIASELALFVTNGLDPTRSPRRPK